MYLVSYYKPTSHRRFIGTLNRFLIRDLAPNQWVSEDVLNGYTKILKDAFNQHPARQFACFNTQFLPQFNAKIKHIRWQAFTDGVDKSNFNSFHIIFVLVHPTRNHWSVVVIDPMKRTTVQFDSLIHSRQALITEGSAGLGDQDCWKKMMLGLAAERWTYRVAKNTIEQPNSKRLWNMCPDDHKAIDGGTYGIDGEESCIRDDTTVGRHEDEHCSGTDGREDKSI